MKTKNDTLICSKLLFCSCRAICETAHTNLSFEDLNYLIQIVRIIQHGLDDHLLPFCNSVRELNSKLNTHQVSFLVHISVEGDTADLFNIRL